MVTARGKSVWPESVLDGVIKETINGVEMLVYKERPKSLSEALENSVNNYPDKEAIIVGETRLTYKQFDKLVNNVAGALKYDYNIQKGDRVALLLMNGSAFCISLFAAARIGAIAIPLNTKLKSNELEFMLQNSSAKLLISDAEWWPNVKPILTKITCENYFINGKQVFEGTLPFTQLTERETPEKVVVPVNEHDTVFIMYTSGTTGLPKGAMGTHCNMIHSAMNYTRCYRITPEDKTIIAVPLFHVTGMIAQLITLIYVGGTAVIMPMFNAEKMLNLLEKEQITHTIVVPTIYTMMLMHPDHKKFNLEHFRCGAFGGAPISGETVRMIKNWIPQIELHNTYGLTETSSPATIMPDWHAESKVNSIGWPVPVGECRVVDPGTAEELPPNVEGELLVKGPMVTPGYWANEEASKKAIVDGWLHTGDVAKIDEDGFVYIMDRIKDMINRGGEKIFCVEVEDVLYSNQKVMEAAVVGVPDEVYGEAVMAIIVPRPGNTLTQEEIQEWVAARLAKYKVPKHVKLVEELPRNPNGKVMKTVLRKFNSVS